MLERIKSFFSGKKEPDPRDAEIVAFQAYVQELETAKSVLELSKRELTDRAVRAEEDLKLSSLTLKHKDAEILRLEGLVTRVEEDLRATREGLSKVLSVVEEKAKDVETDLREKAVRSDSQPHRVKLNFGADTIRDLRLRIASMTGGTRP
jgi:hypothetical protein